MSIIITALKIGFTKISKDLAKEAPGTAFIALNGAVLAGEIAAAKSLGDQSQIYIPVYGPAGIDAGIASFTAVSLGYLAGLGAIAAAGAGITLAPGVGLLALGAGVVAAAVNPTVQLKVFDIFDELKYHFNERVKEGTLPEVILPVGFTDFDFWTVPGSVGFSIISPTLGTTPDPLVKTIIYVDPLILDLDGDGLEITPLSQGVLFDANGNTIKTGTAWAGADDGMLVWDRNGNGLIDSGRELFGDETVLANGTKAAHGFAALSELDVGSTVGGATVGAGDSVFDAKDAQFGNLRIWRDLNQDGVSQAGELQTLAQTGITSIGLANTNPNTNYGDAILTHSGSFTRSDRKTAIPVMNKMICNRAVRPANDERWKKLA